MLPRAQRYGTVTTRLRAMGGRISRRCHLSARTRMTIDPTKLFDEYTLRARIYPGLLAVLPVVSTTLLLWPRSGLNTLWPVVVAAGGLFFLANLVRSRGRKLETRLIQEWDGLPTTHLLRHREADNLTQFARRRHRLEETFGEPLPTPEEE